MKILYLAHNFYTRKTRRKWQIKIESKYNIKLDNPFYDNPNRTEEMKILDSYKDYSKEQNQYLSTRNELNIVMDDLEKIRKSDGIVAFANNVRVGTMMEIFFASYVLRIPTYILTRRYDSHAWIKLFATKIFRNQRELEQFIESQFGKRS